MTIYRPIDWIDWLPKDLYRVGDDGSVWRWLKSRGRWKRLQGRDNGGQVATTLSYKGKLVGVSVGKLVLRAFVGPRPIGAIAMHFPDPDPKNNHLSNLRWAPRGSATLGCPGRPEKLRRVGADHLYAKLDERRVFEIRSLYKRGWTQQEIADEYGVSHQQISKIVRGERWSHIAENSAVADGRKYDRSGVKNPNAKLGELDIPPILAAVRSGVKRQVIAEEYGVSVSTVNRIVQGRAWANAGAAPAEQHQEAS